MNYRFVLVDTESGLDTARWILPPPVVVGRCPTADITIGDVSISRKHCQFLLDPYGSLVVRDLGSKNGVYVDQQKVDKAVVRSGSIIRIGLVTLRLDFTNEDLDNDDVPEVDEVYDLDMGETQPVKIISPDSSS